MEVDAEHSSESGATPLGTQLQEINALIDCFDWENARKKCLEAAKVFSSSIDVFVTLGSVSLELQLFNEAADAFSKAHSLDASCVPALLNLGQLEQSDAVAALAWYEKAVSVLSQRAIEATSADVHFECSVQLSSVFASIAELHMTPDLCDAPNAEEACEQALENALATCPENMEVLCTLASFKLCQQRNEEAREAMKHFHEKLAKFCVMSESEGVDFENGSSKEKASSAALPSKKGNPDRLHFDLLWPSYECRLNAVRLMIEAGDLHEEALNVLLRLEAEDDEVLDVHYLFAFIYAQCGDTESARESIVDAETLIEKRKLQDPDMQQALVELKEQLKEQLAAVSA